MIDLSEEIQAFKEAVYGKDVRAAMVSGAEKIQEEVNDAIEHQLIEVDDTLEVEGAAAEAKVVGSKFGETLRQLPTIGTTGPDDDDYADENGWRVISADTENYPFSSGGLLINYVPAAGNTRYQFAIPYDTAAIGGISVRRRSPQGTWSTWTTPQAFKALPNVTSTGHDAGEYADENGWRAVTASTEHYPFTDGGLLINFAPAGSNTRYQLAIPYSVDSYSPAVRMRSAQGSWSGWVPFSEQLKNKVELGRLITNTYPAGEDATSPVYYDDGTLTIQLDKIVIPGHYLLNPDWAVQNSPIVTTSKIRCLIVESFSEYTDGRFSRQTMFTTYDQYNLCYVRQSKISGGTVVWGDWQRLPVASPQNGKMLVKVNSTLAGATYILNPDWDPDDESSSPWINKGLQPWGNSPYSQIAIRLGVPSEGVNIHGETAMHSSTGLLYAPSSSTGSFIDYICGNESKEISAIPLTDYDIVFTVFWWHDVSGWNLGTINDAVTANTIAGAVHKLVDYMTASNSSCRLILASVIPDRVNVMWGDDVFNYQFSNGQTIAQLDTLMHQMAAKYHFIYIDYQDMNLSYHWRDFCAYNGTEYNGHLNSGDAYRRIGQYLAMHV